LATSAFDTPFALAMSGGVWSPAEPRYFAIEAAAVILSLNPHALRARCRRRAKKDGRNVVAHLGGGILAIKFGVTWRVRFPE
jgi:hypothetical protein